MKNRSRLAMVCCAVLVVAALGVVSPPGVGAATSRVEVVASCTFEPVVSIPQDRHFSVTLSVPDDVEPGAVFDAEILVELDMDVVPPGTDLSEFYPVSEWRVTGSGSPTGVVSVASPSHPHTAGDRYVYAPTTMQVTAPAVAGASIGFELLHVSYRLRHTGTNFTIGPDCELADAPISVASVAVVGAGLTCMGLPVTIAGTPGDDLLVGTGGRDVIHGVGGNNRIFGLGGDDVICGGPGNDIIWGGAGNDRIDGGGGFNLIFGGAGRDSCINGITFGC